TRFMLLADDSCGEPFVWSALMILHCGVLRTAQPAEPDQQLTVKPVTYPPRRLRKEYGKQHQREAHPHENGNRGVEERGEIVIHHVVDIGPDCEIRDGKEAERQARNDDAA